MLKASCVKYEDEEDENQTIHTYYVVLVEDRKRSLKYTLHKRYSDFLQLHLILREKSAELEAFRFPNKSIFNNRSRHTLDRRLEGFNEFLQLAVAMKPLPREVLSFLEISEQGTSRTSSSVNGPNTTPSSTTVHHSANRTPNHSTAEDTPGNATPVSYNDKGIALPPLQTASEKSSTDSGNNGLAGAMKYSPVEEKVKSVLHLIVFAALVLSVAIYSSCVFGGLIDVSHASKSRVVLTLLYLSLLIAFVIAAVTRVIYSTLLPRDRRKRRKGGI